MRIDKLINTLYILLKFKDELLCKIKNKISNELLNIEINKLIEYYKTYELYDIDYAYYCLFNKDIDIVNSNILKLIYIFIFNNIIYDIEIDNNLININTKNKIYYNILNKIINSDELNNCKNDDEKLLLYEIKKKEISINFKNIITNNKYYLEEMINYIENILNIANIYNLSIDIVNNENIKKNKKINKCYTLHTNYINTYEQYCKKIKNGYISYLNYSPYFENIISLIGKKEDIHTILRGLGAIYGVFNFSFIINKNNDEKKVDEILLGLHNYLMHKLIEIK